MSHLASLVVLFVSLFLPDRAFGLAGNLDQPSLSFSADDQVLDREAVMKAICDESYGFLGGFFVNASTTLRYGGGTDDLNRFLKRLSRCRGARLVVVNQDSHIGQDATWRLHHSAWGNPRQFTVSINSSSPHFDKHRLVIPEIGVESGAYRGDRLPDILGEGLDCVPDERQQGSLP